ncbi:MAG: hypothetical protein GWP58_07605 [Gammaproteobacteria bacterium]|jgi:hypothetical protein|nr:hypothetical protein [Gammaproteobacteria bacterium]
MKRIPILIPIVLLSTQTAALDQPAPENLARLLNGEALLLDPQTDGAGGSARVQILAHVPARSFWEVIISCDLAFVFVDGLQSCEVIEDTGERALVHQVVKKGWPIPTQDFVFESLREPYDQMRFGLVEGNLKAMEGLWQFTEIPEGLLVDYQLQVEPGVPAPRFMVRRNIRKDMPDLVACIRGLAGGSGSPAMSTADLARCPGKVEKN